MAIIDTPRAPAIGHLNTGVLGNFYSSTFGAVLAWYDRRATRNELSALSDRDLADLGVHRSQVRSIAWQAAQDA